MLRVVLTLLVGLPMLVPPGTCVCEFVRCSRGLPTPTVNVETATVEAHEPGCCCKRRRTETPPATVAGTNQADADRDPELPCPADRAHDATCVAFQVVRAFGSLEGTPNSVDLAYGLDSVEPLEPVVRPVVSTVAANIRLNSVPLYLTQLPLLI